MQKSSPSADVLPAKHVQKSAVGLHQAGGGLPATADPGTQGRLGRGIDGTRARGGRGIDGTRGKGGQGHRRN